MGGSAEGYVCLDEKHAQDGAGRSVERHQWHAWAWPRRDQRLISSEARRGSPQGLVWLAFYFRTFWAPGSLASLAGGWGFSTRREDI